MKYITDCEAACFTRQEFDLQIVLGMQACDTADQIKELIREVRTDEVRRIEAGEAPATSDWIDIARRIVDENLSGEVDTTTLKSIAHCKNKGDVANLLLNVRLDEAIRQEQGAGKCILNR